MPISDHDLSVLLARFEETPLPELTTRDIRLQAAPGRADVLIGMRRSGKTYVMFQRMRELLAEGIPRGRILYLNLEDDRLGEADLRVLDRSLEHFYRKHPEARAVTSHLFFDEIHVVPGWERFIRRVLDTENVRICLTGSSAKLMSTEVHTSLRGRSSATEVLPFGLRETARREEIGLPETWPPGPRKISRLAALVDHHLVRGGFPDVFGLHPFDRVQALQDYVELVILRDVVERHGVENLTALRHLVQALFAANANSFSVSRLHGLFSSRGIRVGKGTLIDYLGHLTDAYLVFLVPIRTRSEKQRIVNPRKVFSVDPGLAFAMQTAGAENTGALLENLVYLELRRRIGRRATHAVTWYRTSTGREVDFAVDPVQPGGLLELYQVSADLTAAETREREVRALAEAMSETGISEATIVTLSGREDIAVEAGSIRVRPAWDWALSPHDAA
jgi:predicted AAA+ superfamily ATPase